MNAKIDILILNRNMKVVTDNLVDHLSQQPDVNFIGVIDSGSRSEEKSKWTFVGDDSEPVLETGLRPNRGYQLGLGSWIELNTGSEWVLLLPNDSELFSWNCEQLISQIEDCREIVAVIPLSPTNPYRTILPESRIALGWNFHEGPIIFRKDYVHNRICTNRPIFDTNNFRGYLSFIEVAIQAYANNLAIVGTDLISFSENKSHLIKSHSLIDTEPLEESYHKLILEGEQWLSAKYGLNDRWSFELICRLLFEEFMDVNPSFPFSPLV